MDQRIVSYGTSFSRRFLPRRASSLPAPPAIPRGMGADYINEHAPPPAPYYPYPTLQKEHPATLAGTLAGSVDLCYFLRRLCCRRRIKEAPSKILHGIFSFHGLIQFREKEKLLRMIYTKCSERGVNLSNTHSKLELIMILSIYLKYFTILFFLSFLERYVCSS